MIFVKVWLEFYYIKIFLLKKIKSEVKLWPTKIWIFFRCSELGRCIRNTGLRESVPADFMYIILLSVSSVECWHKCAMSIKHAWWKWEGASGSLNGFYFDLIPFVLESKLIRNNWWFKMSLSFCCEFLVCLHYMLFNNEWEYWVIFPLIHSNERAVLVI